MFRFAEHEVVLRLSRDHRAEAKRHHPELATSPGTLQLLDELRIEHGRLDALPVGTGALRVELNHAESDVLPVGFRLGDNDTRILAVAKSLAAGGDDVTVVSKDLPMRVKASAVGLAAEEYQAELAVDSGWTGMAELEITTSEMSELYGGSLLDLDEAKSLPCHTGLVLTSGRGSALGRVTSGQEVRLVRGDLNVFGVHGRSAEQRVAIDLLLDPEIGIVSLGGRAGTGKSALALCAGLEAVLERHQHRKVVVFRPLYAVGGQELGTCPDPSPRR